jgi:hypothetical protein
MRRFRLMLLLHGIVAASVPILAGAQERVDLGDTVACEGCFVTLERVSVVYDETGEAGMSPPAPQAMLITSSGNLFLTTTNPFRPLHFDDRGAFVGTLGTEGQGPGEYQMPMWLAQGPGDTVWAFDPALQRRTAWSPDGEFLATRALPADLPHAVVLNDGELILTGPVMSEPSFGRPLHRVSREGEIVESFGELVEFEAGGHRPGWIRRVLARSGDGGFWASHRTKYSVEKFAQDGALVGSFERSVGWFPPRDPSESTTLAEDGPQPTIRSIVEDDQGFLRILISLPDPRWEEGLGERELQPGFEAAGVYHTPVLNHGRVYDFVIEIIDPTSGAVLASQRNDGYAVGWVDAEHVATYREDEFDIPIIEVFRVEMGGRPEG